MRGMIVDDGKGQRLRGRAGQEARRRRLALHPTCAECKAEGVVTPTHHIDHVTPLALGGLDVDENTQGLCEPHHAAKTALERAGSAAGDQWPTWLPKPACHVHLVVGHIGSGRHDFADQHHQPGDRLVSSVRAMRRDRHLTEAQAIKRRNGMLAALASAPRGITAWVVLSAPTLAERAWWADKLNVAKSMVTVMRYDERRALAVPGAALREVRAWRQQEAQGRLGRGWSPPAPPAKQETIGLDGWPVEEGNDDD